MLGKTAGGLYWMFRYLERSENTARLLDAGFRIALTRSRTPEDEWNSVLTTAGVRDSFVEKAIASNLLIIPGSIFSNHDTHFRISYAASDETIEQGIEILQDLAKQGP